MAYGKPDKWPDGEPRNARPLGSGEATNAKGQAIRHADGTEPPASNFGWLDKTGAAKTDVQGTAYTAIGPGSAAWSKPQGAYSVGDQKRGMKPKR